MLVEVFSVDYFITINLHTQPLDLRCRWRLEIDGDPKACTLVARGQTWKGHASCLKKTQLVGSSEVPTSLHQCSVSPIEG